MPDSQRPHGLQPTRLLRPWDFPGKSTGVGCHRLLHVLHYHYLNITRLSVYLWVCNEILVYIYFILFHCLTFLKETIQNKQNQLFQNKHKIQCESFVKHNSQLFIKHDVMIVQSLSVSDSCGPMDCRLPGSSVHGILQAIILEWVAISFSRGSSQPRD